MHISHRFHCFYQWSLPVLFNDVHFFNNHSYLLHTFPVYNSGTFYNSFLVKLYISRAILLCLLHFLIIELAKSSKW